MVIESIREFNRAVPFTPNAVRTHSGERYVVPHPDFISVSPHGSFAVKIDRQERPHHLSSLHIERVAVLNKRSPRAVARQRLGGGPQPSPGRFEIRCSIPNP